MFLANLSKREKNLFYLTIAIISFALIFNFLLKPLAGKWSQLNQEIKIKEIKLKKNIKYLAQKSKINISYQRATSYIKKTGSDQEEMNFLLNEVERQARASGIRIANIRPKPSRGFGFYQKYVVEANCLAEMSKYINFIYNLEQSDQLIRVEGLKIVSSGKNDPTLKANLLISKLLVFE